MKSAIQILFLLLYTVSSYNTVQSQVADIIDELQHASFATTDTVVHDACKAHVNYTHFREAKKAATEYTASVSAMPGFHRLASIQRFVPQTICLGLAFGVETSAPRAPPANI